MVSLTICFVKYLPECQKQTEIKWVDSPINISFFLKLIEDFIDFLQLRLKHRVDIQESSILESEGMIWIILSNSLFQIRKPRPREFK